MKQSKLLMAGILSSLTLAACAPNEKKSHVPSHDLKGDSIIGGTEVKEIDPILRSVVAVYDKGSKQLCSGSLLENNVIVTAAHCVGSDELYIFFGTALSPQAPRRLVDVIAISNYWETRYAEEQNSGDIALLHFAGTLPDGYKPATMFKDKKALRKDLEVVIAGYGVDNSMAATGSGVLRKTKLKIADPKFSVSEITLDQSHGTSACHGDSGGPAYVEVNGELQLFGVTSRGVNDAKKDCTANVAYTSTIYYGAWITRMQEKIKAYLLANQLPTP